MKKVILIAFALHPKWGSEAGYANTWLEIISKNYLVDVFTDGYSKDAICSNKHVNTKFHFIEGIHPWKKFGVKTGLINVATSIFFRKVKSELKRLNLQDVELIHCITPAGIHSHNDLYKFGVPLVVGPLGGGLPTPPGFKKAFQHQRIKTFLRDTYYLWRLRWNRGLRQYLDNASRVILGLGLRKDNFPEEIRDKCINIPDALVDINYFTPAVKKEEDGIVRVLFAARLISNKGPLLLLDAIKLLLDRGVSDFFVEVAGFGILKDRIEQQIIEHNLGKNIKLLGSLSKEELLNKYQSCDIFCLPTLREPGGIAILEAMACGLPVITSNYGGPSISVTEDCGIKINLSNYTAYVKDLADALVLLMEKPDLRHQMGSMARIRAENEFSIEALSKKVGTLYEDIINKQV
jgi:glycosyltransferase involved in cell wall biosynthesis